ncbi:hypothetical protein RchiOBHm_Chr2g0094131 [Rosa chinensis]|uniref:Interferon-related developmental regulator N-terminal domain-containing protein n=2 Tax=Rosa chinensis TaxID=74649 RepID=A0A2P6RKH2_ROSCH|nr:hypothetical protein RchiOBHm_Chr2g0094131 [Rosa chinensis]
MQDIHRIDTQTLRKKLQDTETPGSIKREIKREIETRQHDQDDAATAVIVENTPQVAAQPAKASPWLIDKLYDKRGPVRAKALAGVIALLNQELDHEDLKKNYVVELLYRCLCGVKKGSTKEVQYSLKVIGLLSIIVDCQDKMSEIYREFLAVSSTSACLKKAGTNTTKMLECLGVVTFFGGINAEETQAGMKVIWDFMMNFKSESGSDDVNNRKKHSSEILVAAIYSWLFLLTSMEKGGLNYWTGAISFFMNLLDNNDDIVHAAACEALALIFEIDSLDKFWNGANDSSLPYSQLRKTLREMILKKLSSLNMNSHVVKYFKTLHFPGKRIPLCEKELVLPSWYRLIQFNYLRSLLGNEFENYMAKENKLQNFFEFDPYRNNNVGEEQLYESTIVKNQKNTAKNSMPEGRDPQTLTAKQRKEEKVRRTSLRNKEQTKLRNKDREMSEELKWLDGDKINFSLLFTEI